MMIELLIGAFAIAIFVLFKLNEAQKEDRIVEDESLEYQRFNRGE